MKKQSLVLALLLLCGIISGQDTIFVRSGQVIPAIIIEKNSTEIKYRKFGPPSSPAIYSVFISDVASIHYNDGIIADYTASGDSGTENKPKTAMQMAGSMKAIRISIGASRAYFKRNEADNLQTFWKFRTGSTTMTENPVYYPINVKANFIMGQSGRNWMGDEFQLIFMPQNAIFASKLNNEIKLSGFYSNIIMYYGHTLNHKKTIAAILEPGLDLAFMSGYIKLGTTPFDLESNFGAGWHIALGIDWAISRRFLASVRAGQRFMSIKEFHKNSESSTGYSTFYVSPGLNEDLLKVGWKGPYASIGLSYCFYAKLKMPQQE